MAGDQGSVEELRATAGRRPAFADQTPVTTFVLALVVGAIAIVVTTIARTAFGNALLVCSGVAVLVTSGLFVAARTTVPWIAIRGGVLSWPSRAGSESLPIASLLDVALREVPVFVAPDEFREVRLLFRFPGRAVRFSTLVPKDGHTPVDALIERLVLERGRSATSLAPNGSVFGDGWSVSRQRFESATGETMLVDSIATATVARGRVVLRDAMGRQLFEVSSESRNALLLAGFIRLQRRAPKLAPSKSTTATRAEIASEEAPGKVASLSPTPARPRTRSELRGGPNFTPMYGVVSAIVLLILLMHVEVVGRTPALTTVRWWLVLVLAVGALAASLFGWRDWWATWRWSESELAKWSPAGRVTIPVAEAVGITTRGETMVDGEQVKGREYCVTVMAADGRTVSIRADIAPANDDVLLRLRELTETIELNVASALARGESVPWGPALWISARGVSPTRHNADPYAGTPWSEVRLHRIPGQNAIRASIVGTQRVLGIVGRNAINSRLAEALAKQSSEPGAASDA